MPAATLHPRPGFDWTKVRWRLRREETCAYCGEALSEEEVPLALYRDNGLGAEFCTGCARAWFGMESFPSEPEGG